MRLLLVILLFACTPMLAFAQSLPDMVQYFASKPTDPNYGAVQDAAAASAKLQGEYDTVKQRMLSGNAKPEDGGLLQNIKTDIGTQDSIITNAYAAATDGIQANAQSPCAPEEKRASSICTLGMDQMAEAALKGAINTLTEYMKQSGSEKTCKQAQTVQSLAMGANFAQAVACDRAVKACTTTCETKAAPLNGKPDPVSKAQLAAANKSKMQCEQLESRAVASMVQGFQNATGMLTSGQCQKAISNATPPPGASGTPPPGMDCSNPMMASQAVCICGTNPHDPVCSASNNGGVGLTGFASDGNNGAAAPTDLKDANFSLGEDIPLQTPNAAGQAQAAGSSGGGGGPSGGGGAAALPPEETGGAGAGPYKTDIMGGTAGGSGGGGFTGGGGGGSGDKPSMFDSLAEKFNLKGFLPSKADFKNRGLASGSGADGITGPNGPSLFEKVSARYQKKQSELLP